MTQPSDLLLGRIEGPPDARDRNFPMANVLRLATNLPTSRYWYPGQQPLNQGSLGACVGFTGANWLQNSPTRTPVTNQTGFDLYAECKKIDGIPNTEGTYARALLKVLQSQGKVGQYLWAQRPLDIKEWVLSTGPVLVGTPWLEGMFALDMEGYARVQGYEVGGHEYLIRGYSRPRDAYRCRNSWGAGWGIGASVGAWAGNGGEFWLRRADLDNLIFASWGDAVGVVEV